MPEVAGATEWTNGEGREGKKGNDFLTILHADNWSDHLSLKFEIRY